MHPTPEQIAVAAYYRWERRGHGHGRDLDDWDASARDLAFGLNYRWVVRHALRPTAGTGGGPVRLGQAQAEAAGRPRHCRYCERSAPTASFAREPWAIPPAFGNTSLIAWDECDDCRAQYEQNLADPFDAFAAPFLAEPPRPPDPAAGIPVPALKALVRMGLSVLPAQDLHHFDDAVEWVGNPDAARDAALLGGLGCHVYLTPAPVPAPFASLARRSDDDARTPYILFFLGTGRVVFQTHLPFCPLDEEIDDDSVALRGPALSMSLGNGHELRTSDVAFLPVAAPTVPTPEPVRIRLVTRA